MENKTLGLFFFLLKLNIGLSDPPGCQKWDLRTRKQISGTVVRKTIVLEGQQAEWCLPDKHWSERWGNTNRETWDWDCVRTGTLPNCCWKWVRCSLGSSTLENSRALNWPFIPMKTHFFWIWWCLQSYMAASSDRWGNIESWNRGLSLCADRNQPSDKVAEVEITSCCRQVKAVTSKFVSN